MRGFLHLLLLLNVNSLVLSCYVFGTNNSRIEYDHARGKYRKQFQFTLDVKANGTDGIIFYASDNDHTNYISLFLKDGHVVYKLQSNNDVTTLQSLEPLNDNEWHIVTFSHDHSTQRLIVDNVQQGESTLESASKVDVHTPFILGGIREDQEARVYENIKMVQSFRGCARNFLMNNKPMEKPRKTAIGTCPENFEEGNYFNGGYIILKPRYIVGDEISIKMDIKARNITGLLLAVHGKRDYLVLEMVNGAIRFVVENGRGPITTSFLPDRTHYLCDGQWHTIQAVKSKNVVSLSVDNKHIEPGVGDHRSKSTDTGGALFLGSHRVVTKLRGITARVPFIGCIKNILINTEPYIIHPNMRRGEVMIGQCPTN